MSSRPRRRKTSKPAAPNRRGLYDEILSACAPIADLDTAFSAELAMSSLLGGAYAAADVDRADAVLRFASGFSDHLANEPSRPARAVLSVLSAVAPSPAAERAGGAADALQAAGIEAPDWVDHVGEVRCTGAWTLSDTYGDQTEYVAVFAYTDEKDGGPPHAVCLLGDHNLRVIKDCWVGSPPDRILDECRSTADSDPDLIFTEAEPARVRAEVAKLIAGTDLLEELPESETLVEERALTMARLALLPDDVPAPEKPGPEQRDEVVAGFLGSRLGALDGPDPQVVEACARLLVDYAVDHNSGDPLRWSPTAVESLLLDWAPRSAVIDEECTRWLPVVLDAFVGYAGLQRGLSMEALAATRDAVTEHAADFAELMMTGASRTPVTELVTDIIAAGIDLTDEVAVREWLAQRNNGKAAAPSQSDPEK